MSDRTILLVEDNPDDQALTIRAFAKNNITNPVVVAQDGVEALDYIFGTGIHAGRDVNDRPAIVLLDLKLPKLDGIGVLKRIRADERTRLVPVVIPMAIASAAIRMCASPSTSIASSMRRGSSGSTGCFSTNHRRQ
jgi:CheY-like chemotaxis protein